MAFEFTDKNFEETAIASDKIVMVDFWAQWCGPCRMVSPIIEELASEYEDKALIGKVNVDDNPEISFKYGIRNIPTVLYLKNGEVVDKQIGATTKTNFEKKLLTHIS